MNRFFFYKNHVTIVFLLLCSFFAPVLVRAEGLPTIPDGEGFGLFSYNKTKAFKFYIDDRGLGVLLLSKKGGKKYVGQDYTIKITPKLMHVNSSGERKVKRFRAASFKSEAPKVEDVEQSYTVEATGGVKLQFDIKYEKERIILNTKVLSSGEMKREDLQLAYNVKVPAMYTKRHEGMDLKERRKLMRRDKISFIKANGGGSASIKSYEGVDLSSDDVVGDGITMWSAKIGAQEGKKLLFTTVGGDYIFNVKTKDLAPCWEGYTVEWISPLADSLSAEEYAGSAFVIEVD